jgi:hypothetical protein
MFVKLADSLFPTRKTPMGPLDALWHLLNFFAPAVGVAAIAAALTKLLWWRELKGASWWRLWVWAAGCGAVVSIAGLVFFGRDGKMATYAVMVVSCALGLWLAAFGPARR